MTTGISRNGVYLLGLTLLALLVICILNYEERPIRQEDNMNQSIQDVIESGGQGLSEFGEEIKDEIDDNTDSR